MNFEKVLLDKMSYARLKTGTPVKLQLIIIARSFENIYSISETCKNTNKLSQKGEERRVQGREATNLIFWRNETGAANDVFSEKRH